MLMVYKIKPKVEVSKLKQLRLLQSSDCLSKQ